MTASADNLNLNRSPLIRDWWFRICMVSLAVSLLAVPARLAAEQSAEIVEYHRDIAPLLQKKCQACHAAKVHEGDIWLDSYERVIKGGPDGALILPGQPDVSRLLQLASRHEEPAMPPLPNDVQATALTAAEIDLLKRWITTGARQGDRPQPVTDNWREIPASKQQVYSLALSPDQRTLLASRANQIVHYDLLSRSEVTRLVDPQLGKIADHDFIQTLAFSPDGRRVAAGGYRNVKIWERLPASFKADLKLEQPVSQMRVDPTGIRAAFQLLNHQLVIWDLRKNTSLSLQNPDQDSVTAFEFASDGQTLFTGTSAGSVQFWNSQSGAKVAEFKSVSGVTALAASDNTGLLLTGHLDGTLRVWKETTPVGEGDLAQPVPVRELKGGADAIVQMQLVMEGTHLIAASGHTVQKWDVVQGNSIWQQKLDAAVLSIVSTADANRIAVASQSGRIELWNQVGEVVADLSESSRFKRSVQVHSDSVEIALKRLAADNVKLAQAQAALVDRQKHVEMAIERNAGARKIVDVLTQELAIAEQDQKKAEAALAEDPASEERQKLLATAKVGCDKKSALHSNATAASLVTERAIGLAKDAVKVGESSVALRAANVSMTTSQLASAQLQLEDIQKKAQVPDSPCRSLTLSDADDAVLALRTGCSPSEWDSDTGRPLEQYEFETESAFQFLLSAQGHAVGVDASGVATCWDLIPRWQLLQVLGPQASEPHNLAASRIAHRVNTLAFHPDGQHLATGGGEPSRSGELLLWDLSSPDDPVEFVDAHSDTILDLQFSRNGERLATCSADKFCKLFDLRQRRLLKSFEGHTDHVLGLSLSADDATLVSGSADRLLKVWDVETGELRRSIENDQKQVTAVNFIGISGRIVSASGDCHVMFHDASNGQSERSFVGAQDYVYCAITSADGRLVIAGGEDGIVRIWNGITGEQVMTFEPTQSAADAVTP